jgi:transposase-like protein
LLASNSLISIQRISIQNLSTASSKSKKSKKKKGKGSDSEDEGAFDSISQSASAGALDMQTISSDEDSDEDISEEYRMIKDKLTFERQQEQLGVFAAGDDIVPARIPEKQSELIVKWMERLYSDHPYWQPEDTRSDEEKEEYARLKKLHDQKLAEMNAERLILDKKRFEAAEKAIASLPEDLFKKATVTYHPPPFPPSIVIPLPPRPENWPYVPGPPK